jgi:hypothetical protein
LQQETLDTANTCTNKKGIGKMSAKKAIKVIKKEERNRQKPSSPKGPGARETAREMVQTVTDWVNDLHQKQRAETADALKLLLSESPRTSEA